MLGWMLNRGDNAPDADAGDNTLADMPDTPAPVFAARALKTALFGTPRNNNNSRPSRPTNQPSQTPNSKPQGILMTPGTGAAKQKRVSFGRDVGSSKADDSSSKGDEPHRRTRLNETLQKAQQKKTSNSSKMTTKSKRGSSDDEWEEDDDDYDDYDMTLDLNEPHSESGRYWKQEFETYRVEARAEMEKLLRYKQLAKAYAQQKDTEAMELGEKLHKAQQKVINMEKKIAESTSDILSRHENGSPDETVAELADKLAKETAQVIQYRQSVEALESQIESVLEDRNSVVAGAESKASSTGSRRPALSAISPKTQKLLQDTQRELHKARTQAKEVNSLRDEVSSLKQQLRAAEKRAAKAELGVRSEVVETDRSRDLRAQLREAREQARKKDDEILAMQRDFDAFRKESQERADETGQVLERAHDKIADLKKEIKTLKAAAASSDRHRDKPATHDQNPVVHQDRPQDKPAEQPAPSPARATSTSRLQAIRARTATKSASHLDTPSLRDKFHDDATNTSAVPDPGDPNVMSGGLGTDRPRLSRPVLQSVPRSPAGRSYSPGRSPARRPRSMVAAIPSADTPARLPRDANIGDLSVLAESLARNKISREEEQREAATTRRQPSPVRANSVTTAASKSRLPPERRAAALARIEQRRAEKQRERALDKENVRP